MVILNVLVFFVMSFAGSTEDIEFMLEHGAMYVPAVLENGEYYRFFTCMFIHFGFMHLAGNMVVLMFLGDNVERATGKIRFILIYILGGLMGSIGSFIYAMSYNPGIVSAGASGAIFALIGALLWLVIRNKGRLEDMTTLKMCVLIAYALYNGIASKNVDMAAHLFGLVGGFLAAIILYRKNDRSSIQ
ncbi:MAG: rhomboid family intramembrane serine protease [Lachnospiraceae bacterium]|nr:rhomboid family intramembrane serine protease [Lachnospiraceae bacterium]